jgi:ribosome maturation protein SDO1
MVSLDDAVLARLEKGGKRYEVLVDSELVDAFQENPESVNIDDLLAIDEVFHDARAGDRPTEEALTSNFDTLDIVKLTQIILDRGSIQLTTNQRKAMVETKRQQIIHEIHSTAVDPRTKSPHPRTRIELAFEESKFNVDPFKTVEVQVKEAVAMLKPMIPLSFEAVRLAFRIPAGGYQAVHQFLRTHVEKDEWLSNGDWACVIECSAAIKDSLVSKVLGKAKGSEVKEI